MGGGGAGKRKTRAAGEEGVDADDDPENLALQVVAQKPKTVDDRAVSIVGVPSQQPHPKPGMNRTSSLDAPIMLLEGTRGRGQLHQVLTGRRDGGVVRRG